MSSHGGSESPCRCSWGIKRLERAAHPLEGSGLRCAAACPVFNWVLWQWVPCCYWAECWSGVSTKQPRPVILPVILKVTTVDQHGRKKQFSATCRGLWTGVPQRCVDEAEGFVVEEEGKRKVKKYGVGCLPGSNLPSAFPWYLTAKSFSNWLTAEWIRKAELVMKLPAVHRWMWTAMRTKWLNN